MTFHLLPFGKYWRGFLAFSLALTAARILALVFGDPNLGPDEAQYWYWSQTPAFGYYSKPPLVAWAIAATTSVFGDAEWSVRLAAPLFQLGAAIFIFLTARKLSDERAAFWAGLGWLTLPGVFLSAAVITTDGPLLFFWSAALYFFVLWTDEKGEQRTACAAALGLSLGLGLLSKYAMLYFAPGAVLALLAAPERRRRIEFPAIAACASIALIVLAPNIIWNARNDFQTIAHTAANANWTQSFGHPEELLTFLGDQFGVVGPVMLLLIITAAAASFRTREANLRLLLAISVPALLIVATQAFIARAHANWAAVAYPSAIIAATIFANNLRWASTAIKASFGLHLIIGAGFLFAFTSYDLADTVGASAPFKRLRGWDSHGADIRNLAAGYDAILSDDREVMGALLYYARGAPPVVAWNPNGRIDNHYEAFKAFDPLSERRLLYVTTSPDPAPLNNSFTNVAPIGTSRARMTSTRERTLYLFEVSDYRLTRN